MTYSQMANKAIYDLGKKVEENRKEIETLKKDPDFNAICKIIDLMEENKRLNKSIDSYVSDLYYCY